MIDLLVMETGETISATQSVPTVETDSASFRGLSVINNTNPYIFFAPTDNITIVGVGLFIDHNLQLATAWTLDLVYFPTPTDPNNLGSPAALVNINAVGAFSVPKEGVLYNFRNYCDMTALTNPEISGYWALGAYIPTGIGVSMAYCPAILEGVTIHIKAAVLVEHTLPLVSVIPS